MIAPFGRGWIACRFQQIASQPMQLSLDDPHLGRLDYPRRLDEAIQSFSRLSEHIVGRGEPVEQTQRE